MYIDDALLQSSGDGTLLVTPFGKRKITHAFHDIDGTHSLIRDWPPVMSLTLYNVIENGLPDGYDSDENIKKLILRSGKQELPETDRFCVESAGLSALTQMEWSIRRAVENGTISAAEIDMDEEALRVNSDIIKRIWAGEELFEDIKEPVCFKNYLKLHTPKLFRVYEQILNGACRDVNLEAARRNPEQWRVRGSVDFLETLFKMGVKNYFVTGAVIAFNEDGQPYGGMYDEVIAAGFPIGDGQLVEALHGSTWDEKIPKNEVMRRLCEEESINPENVLVIGDGRSEIAAGAEMGAVTVSVLPEEAERQRDIHINLNTNLIIPYYTKEFIGGLT